MSAQYCVDANIFIQPWHNIYPQTQEVFRPVWELLAEHRHKMILIKPIYDQIEPMRPDERNLALDERQEKYPLRIWLEENNFDPTPLDDSVEALSLRLERKYEIDNTPRGANQTDIKLISFAKLMNKKVVTLESPQPEKPQKKSHYKIPLICKEERVDCINFVEMLEQLQI